MGGGGSTPKPPQLSCPHKNAFNKYRDTDAWAADGQAPCDQGVCLRPLKSGLRKVGNYNMHTVLHPCQPAFAIQHIPLYRTDDKGVDPWTAGQPIGLAFKCEGNNIGGLGINEIATCTGMTDKGELKDIYCGSSGTNAFGVKESSLCDENCDLWCSGNHTLQVRGRVDYPGTCKSLAPGINMLSDGAWLDSFYFFKEGGSGDRPMGDLYCPFMAKGREDRGKVMGAWPELGLSKDVLPLLIRNSIAREICDKFSDEIYNFSSSDPLALAVNILDPVSRGKYANDCVNDVISLSQEQLASVHVDSFAHFSQALQIPKFILNKTTSDIYVAVPVYFKAAQNTLGMDGNQLGSASGPKVQELLQRFLRDPPNNMIEINSPDKPDENIMPTFSDAYSIWMDSDGNIHNYDLQKSFTPFAEGDRYPASDDFPLPDAGGNFILARVYVAKVVKLSLASVLFIAAENPTEFNQNQFCKRLLQEFSQPTIYTAACLKNDCNENPKDCLDQKIPTTCNQTITNDMLPGLLGAARAASKYLAISSSQGFPICACADSRLAPAVESKTTLKAARCFTQSCRSDKHIESLFELNDDECKKYCPEVKTWLTTSDFDQQSRFPAHLDKAKFDELCNGGKSLPRDQGGFNLPVFVVVTSFACIFVVLPSIMWASGWTRSLLILIAAIFCALCGYALAGTSNCSDNEMTCRDQLLGSRISNFFCKHKLACECVIDEDCFKSGNAPDSKWYKCENSHCTKQDPSTSSSSKKSSAPEKSEDIG